MQLVHVNRHRLEFVKMGFSILGASDALVDEISDCDNFQNIFNEVLLWSGTDQSDEKLEKIAKKVNENILDISNNDWNWPV